MMTLWFFITLLTLIALVLIIIPLLHIPKKHALQQTQAQVVIYREQLRNLEEQLRKSEITVEDYEQSRCELEQSLLEEVPAEENKVIQNSSSYLTAIIVTTILPIIAILLYLHWGNSQALSQWQLAQQDNTKVKAEMAKLGSTQNVITALQAKLQQDPNSAKGWYLLGKLYLSQQKFTDAVAALNKANLLQPNDPDIMENYAESLFFTNQEKLNIQAKTLLTHVLTLQPTNINAINLFALNAYRNGDYQSAIQYWERLLPVFPPESNDGKTLLAMIAQAQQHVSAKTMGIKILVHVALATELNGKVGPGDTVFIYAKALAGPPMPLAVVRQLVRNLPMTITLTSADAMIPTATLANFQQVKIFARISKSGQVVAQAGDLQGESGIIQVKQKKTVDILINHTL